MWIEEIVDRESQQKLYVQMCAILRSKIEKREWPPGIQIPTEDELCRTYDVSKATVRIAISVLAREGCLKRIQGKGTFVTYSMPNIGMTMKTKLTENMLGEGVRAKREILEKGLKELSGDVKKYFNTGSEVYYIICKRVVEGEPAYIEESYVPLSVMPGIENEDVCNVSFYDLIQEKAVRKVVKVVQTIEVAEPDGNLADILKLKKDLPALLLHRLFVGSDGAPVAYMRLTGNGRKYKIQTEFERIR